MPQENAEPGKGDVEYFVVAPDGKVYNNPYNLSTQNIKNFKKFKQMFPYGGSFYRFAVDPQTSAFYIQDPEWREAMNSGDNAAWDTALNPAIEFVKKKFGIKQPKKEFGEPEDSASLGALSGYTMTWDYLTEFLKREGLGEPNDTAVVEFVGDDDDNSKVSFHPKGFSKGNVTTKGPTFAIDRRYFLDPTGLLDYGKVNHQLIFCVLKNMDDPELREKAATGYEQMFNPRTYNVFFAGFSKSGPEVRKADTRQSDKIQNEQTLRSSLRTAKCKACGQINGGLATQCSHCGGTEFEYGPEYTGPLVLFSYLPDRKQLVFQNQHPEEMQHYSTYRELLGKIKSTISAAYSVPENELVLSFDPSSHAPFVSQMSSYRIAWNYIVNIMCPKEGKEPKDIPVVEAPVPMKGARAAFIANPSDEEKKTEGGQEYRVSYGLSVPYPFIMVDIRARNIGGRFSSMIHEYKHFLDIGEETIKSIPTYEDPDESFLAYIRHPHEQSAHYDQMFYSLMMGMKPMEILDTFAGDDMLRRAEYGKILDKARADYKAHRDKSKPPIPTVTAGMSPEIPAVMDWWNIEMQGFGGLPDLPRRSDRLSEEESEYRDAAKGGLEELVSIRHDKQSSFMKSLEQLLQESRI